MKQYTQSELKTFRDCRRKWWLQNYLKLRLRPQYERPSAARQGTLVHAGLEVFYPDADSGWRGVLDEERDRLQQLLEDQVVNGEWYDKMIDQVEFARIMLEGYVEWLEETGEDQGLEFIETETVIEVEIDGVKFKGKIDAKVLDLLTNERLFLDHKTTGSFEMLWNGLEIEEQFLHYEMLNRGQDDSSPTGGVIVNGIRKVKRTASSNPPFYERKRRSFSKEQVDNYTTRALAIVADIEDVNRRLDDGESHQTAAYPRPNSECHWKCEFFAVCAMFDDGSDIDRYLEDYYECGDPEERYKQTSNGKDL